MSQIHPKRRMLVLTLLVVAAVVPFIGAPGPAVAAPAKCTALQQVLGQCRKPTTTTTVAPTTTTTTPNPACGGYATVPKTGGGVWTCDFSD